MSTPTVAESLDGFDPLEADDGSAGTSLALVLEEASKRIVHNILKSYTGYFDLFSELLQTPLMPSSFGNNVSEGDISRRSGW